jgi:hypothetical protein
MVVKMAITALSVGDLMRGDARLVVAIGYGQAQECVYSKDGLVSQIPDHNLKAQEAVLICRARRRIGTDWREHEQLPPNGSFILSLKGWTAEAAAWELRISMPRPCTLLGLERLWGKAG